MEFLQPLVEFLKLRLHLTSMQMESSLSLPLTSELGKKQDITITGSSTFPSDERMVNEAENFSKEDKEKRDAIDTKNQADSVVYQTEKQLKEIGDKVPAPVKEKVEAKLEELKDAISGGSTQAMKDAMSALNQEVMQLANHYITNQVQQLVPAPRLAGELALRNHQARDLKEMSSMPTSQIANEGT